MDSHKKFERRQFVWLLVSYAIIALMTAAIMLYGALQSGWRRPSFPWEAPSQRRNNGG